MTLVSDDQPSNKQGKAEELELEGSDDDSRRRNDRCVPSRCLNATTAFLDEGRGEQ
jgi:hypothetical protein